MNEINTASLIGQMQRMAAKAQSGVEQTAPTDDGGFSVMFKKALGTVNDLTQQADVLKTRYELGDDKVSISEVMVAVQKSSVAFEGAVQMRNKFVKAYEDIMSLPL